MTYIRHGYGYHPVYRVWRDMMYRCYKERRHDYVRYGGRGIRVCEEWHDPGSFCEWALDHGYQKGLFIDRIDNDKNYEPSNCRFLTRKESDRNRRTNVVVTINGQSMAFKEAWEKYTDGKVSYQQSLKLYHKSQWAWCSNGLKHGT